MGFDNVSTKNFAGSDTAIVRSLGSGEAVLRPAKWVHIVVEQSILLLDAEPRLLVGGQLHRFQTRVAVVRFGWFLVVLVRVAKDESVVSQVERVPIDGHWIQIDVRVAAFCLISRATIVIPNGQF